MLTWKGNRNGSPSIENLSPRRNAEKFWRLSKGWASYMPYPTSKASKENPQISATTFCLQH